MKKLNKRKIRWIVREVERRENGLYTIAKTQDITPRWAREVHKKFKNVKDPILLKPGRKAKPTSEQEKSLVKKLLESFWLELL